VGEVKIRTVGAKAPRRIVTMSVQKKSLIGSRAAETKVATHPSTGAKVIGGSKTLSANAMLTVRGLKKRAAKTFTALKKKR
jgi:hypothetical protein